MRLHFHSNFRGMCKEPITKMIIKDYIVTKKSSFIYGKICVNLKLCYRTWDIYDRRNPII